MSGFESAIRNAIARAPDGRPQTRQRVYDAARASLERNLARIEVPDADQRRRTLELTIERIEEEWRAIAMRHPERSTPQSPRSGSREPPEPVPSDDPERAMTEGEPERPVSPPAADELAATSPTVERGSAVGRADAVVDGTGRAGGIVSRDGLDPALVRQLAERDGRPATVAPAEPPPVERTANNDRTATGDRTATDDGAHRTGAPRPTVAPAGGNGASVPEQPVASGGPEAGPVLDAVPEVGPAVEVTAEPARRDRRRTRPKDARRAKRARPSAGRKASTGGRRGRWASRAVSLAVLVGIAVPGWLWLDRSGMLEPTATERVAVTRPNATSPASGETGGAWTDLLTREIAGAVEPVVGQEALRVTGAAEVALDAAALTALGPDISVSLLVRAVERTGEVAVSCRFAEGGCGRLRFPLPREAEERVLNATIGASDEARLVFDPAVGGEAVAFDILGVSARAR